MKGCSYELLLLPRVLLGPLNLVAVTGLPTLQWVISKKTVKITINVTTFWIIKYKQQFLHKNMSINPRSVEFHQCHTKRHSNCFFSSTTISKITTEKTPTRTWRCKLCIMQMSYLYASDVHFKNFLKLAQHAETIRKYVWEKSYDAYSLSIRVQTTINHISICCLPQYQRQTENVSFFQSASWKRHCATHWREQLSKVGT